MDIIPDAKLILIAMINYGLLETSFRELQTLLNCPLDELDSGRTSLFTDRISIARKMSDIKLGKEWELLVEWNANAQLQSRTPANPTPDETNGKPGNPEGSTASTVKPDSTSGTKR